MTLSAVIGRVDEIFVPGLAVVVVAAAAAVVVAAAADATEQKINQGGRR